MIRTLLISAALISVALVSPASAHTARHVRLDAHNAYRVDFRDLNLGHREDRAELMSRIVFASRLLCDRDVDGTVRERNACVHQAVSNALDGAPESIQASLRNLPEVELAER